MINTSLPLAQAVVNGDLRLERGIWETNESLLPPAHQGLPAVLGGQQEGVRRPWTHLLPAAGALSPYKLSHMLPGAIGKRLHVNADSRDIFHLESRLPSQSGF